jgi:hypothetical protein
MRECLWEVADESLAGNAVLLREQADVVPKLDHASKHVLGVVVAAEEKETLR